MANTEREGYPILATKAPGIPDFGHWSRGNVRKRKDTKLDFSYIQTSGKYVFKGSPYVNNFLDVYMYTLQATTVICTYLLIVSDKNLHQIN